MFLSIFKLIIFAALVLLLGQIPVGNNSIAGHLQASVLKSINWTGNELKQTKLFATISQAPKAKSWLHAAPPAEKSSEKKTAAKPKVSVEHASPVKIVEPEMIAEPEKTPSSDKVTQSEKITQSDRESLRRLLQ